MSACSLLGSIDNMASWDHEYVRHWQPYCRYEGHSTNFQFVFEKEGSSFADNVDHVLSIFQAEEIPLTNREFTEESGKQKSCDDILLHVGGPVWSLDWCPERPSWRTWRAHAKKEGKEFLAVGAHPVLSSSERLAEPSSVHHILGEPLSGKALVQIWGFSFNLRCDSTLDKPRKEQSTLVNPQRKPTIAHKQPDRRKSSLSEQDGIIAHGIEEPLKNGDFVPTNPRQGLTGKAENIYIKSCADTTGFTYDIDSRSGKEMEQSDQLFERGGCLHPGYADYGKGTNKAVIKLKDMARGKGSDVSPAAASPSGKTEDGSNMHGNEHPAKMVLGLIHEGEVAWDLKWRPVGDFAAVADDRESLRLGILALVLGDGSLQVLDVPNPSALKALSRRRFRDGFTVVKIQPIFKCSELRSGGHKR